ncbi:hypothetical protein IFM89_016451 [Coptis chinensis]|uniref:Peptidase S8/S53 domain-containing protein n=1 Tax=Coptis chinensis TaxID=261450 RepID=A0A835GWR8_9MAGN|nr:hypothetical protein IFM89_016451 [Coptis chinensis]
MGLPTIDRSKDFDQASMDVIIGVLDTGVWPELKSFDDSKMEPVPSHWKRECESGPDFSSSLSNEKLIGAHSFSKGFKMASSGSTTKKPLEENESPCDQDGHGMHTASTAAGSHVANACLLGYTRGTAHDGVDVLSLSLGGGSAPYYCDTIAIDAFTAVEKVNFTDPSCVEKAFGFRFQLGFLKKKNKYMERWSSLYSFFLKILYVSCLKDIAVDEF